MQSVSRNVGADLGALTNHLALAGLKECTGTMFSSWASLPMAEVWGGKLLAWVKATAFTWPSYNRASHSRMPMSNATTAPFAMIGWLSTCSRAQKKCRITPPVGSGIITMNAPIWDLEG